MVTRYALVANLLTIITADEMDQALMDLKI